MPILNYTTTVAAAKSVAEIQATLTKAGASRIMIENNADREPSALVFELHHRQYRLPCRHKEVHKVLNRQRGVEARYRTLPHALKVAWRNLKDWVEAQVAIMECEMVKGDEVFMPYLVMSTGETMWEHYNARQLEDKKP